MGNNADSFPQGAPPLPAGHLRPPRHFLKFFVTCSVAPSRSGNRQGPPPRRLGIPTCAVTGGGVFPRRLPGGLRGVPAGGLPAPAALGHPEPGGEKALALLQTRRTCPPLPPRPGKRARPRGAPPRGKQRSPRGKQRSLALRCPFPCATRLLGCEKHSCKVAEPANFATFLLRLRRSSSLFYFGLIFTKLTLSHPAFCVCSCHPLLVF